MARPKAQITREQTGFRLRPELVKAFRYIAVDTGKPVNVVIEEALEEYLQARGINITQPGSDTHGE